MLDYIVSTVIGGLVAMGASLLIGRIDLEWKRETKYGCQVIEAYGRLSEALCKYNFDCIRITRSEISRMNAPEMMLECQTVFFELQYEFWRPLLIEDEYLQKMLDKIRNQSVTMENNVMTLANDLGPTKQSGKIDNMFMSDLSESVKDINKYLGQKVEETIRGKGKGGKRS